MTMIYLYIIGLILTVTFVRSEIFGHVWNFAVFPFKTLLLFSGPAAAFCTLIERSGIPFPPPVIGLYCYAVMYFNLVVCVSVLKAPTFITVLTEAFGTLGDRPRIIDQYRGFLAEIVGGPVTGLQQGLSNKYKEALKGGNVRESPFINLLLSTSLTAFMIDSGHTNKGSVVAGSTNSRPRQPSAPPPPPQTPYPIYNNNSHHLTPPVPAAAIASHRSSSSNNTQSDYVDIELPYGDSSDGYYYDSMTDEQPSTYDPAALQDPISLNNTPPMTSVDEVVIEDDVDPGTGRQGALYNKLAAASAARTRSESRSGSRRRKRRTASDNSLEKPKGLNNNTNYTYNNSYNQYYNHHRYYNTNMYQQQQQPLSQPISSSNLRDGTDDMSPSPSQAEMDRDYDLMAKIHNPDGSTINIDPKYITPKLPLDDHERRMQQRASNDIYR